MMTQTLDPNLARQFDRVVPHSVEAEENLIGSILNPGGEKYLSEARSIVTTEMFFSADRQIIWATIGKMVDRGIPIDLTTLYETIKNAPGNVLNEIGGAAYFARLFDTVPFSAHASHYASIVRDKAARRKSIEIGNELLRLAYEGMESEVFSARMMEKSEELIRVATNASAGGPMPLGESLQSVLDRQGRPANRIIPTGLRCLDTLIGGLGYGLTTVIAGQAGMGKSQLGKQIVANVASINIPCGIITVEENREKIAENYLASRSTVPNHKIAYDQLTDSDWNKLRDAAPDLAKLPIYIEDAAFSLSEIEIAARRLVSKYGCRLIMVDHIHLIATEDENRTNQVSKISSGLKRLYRRLNVAGLSLAQLNRSHQAGERPTLRSLRDSGTIEQDGDVILLLYREDYFKYKDDGYTLNNKLEIDVAKNKFGGPGVAVAQFDGNSQTVKDFEDGSQAVPW